MNCNYKQVHEKGTLSFIRGNSKNNSNFKLKFLKNNNNVYNVNQKKQIKELSINYLSQLHPLLIIIKLKI